MKNIPFTFSKIKNFSKPFYPQNIYHNWTSCPKIQGVILLTISNRPHTLNCTPLSPITITKYKYIIFKGMVLLVLSSVVIQCGKLS